MGQNSKSAVIKRDNAACSSSRFGLAYREGLAQQIHLLPAQAANLTSAKASIERKHHERVERAAFAFR